MTTQVMAVSRDEEITEAETTFLADVAGLEAGLWHVSRATHAGYELVAAGMLIMAGGGDGTPLDYNELERWTRVGYERGMRFRKGGR